MKKNHSNFVKMNNTINNKNKKVKIINFHKIKIDFKKNYHF